MLVTCEQEDSCSAQDDAFLRTHVGGGAGGHGVLELQLALGEVDAVRLQLRDGRVDVLLLQLPPRRNLLLKQKQTRVVSIMSYFQF